MWISIFNTILDDWVWKGKKKKQDKNIADRAVSCENCRSEGISSLCYRIVIENESSTMSSENN